MNLQSLITFILLLQMVAQATPMGNGPYSPSERPLPVPLRKLEFTKQVEFTKQTGETGFYRSAEGQSELRLSIKAMDEGIYLEIIRAGQIRFPKSQMCPSGMLDYGSAYQADLNQDGRPDYVLEYATGGNGITPVYVIFLLSTGEGYALTCTTSHFEESDFILIQGKPRMIHSDLGQIEKCADGKLHSFWTYNLLAFDKGDVKLDNRGAGVFPKVVWYSNAPNYRETTMLNAEQKAELIRWAQSYWREKLE
jgi:hypothetical protein